MELTILFFDALIDLSNAMAPYILFGLLFAGILHELVPESLVTKHLGKEDITSVVKSTIFGIPLPVCSCGVVPLATSIKKSGASKGATLSFLISTPITGLDSILATYGMFGWAFTLYRVFSSMLIAMAAGILTNLLDKSIEVDKPMFSVTGDAPSMKPMASPFAAAPPKEKASCCSSASNDEQKPTMKAFSMIKAVRYAFITLLGDIARPLVWGLLIGAAITVAIPQDLSEMLSTYTWASYLIVIVIAIPMYVCATASLPIAAGLMLSGVSAGAAFVFLSAGPATNTVTIGVVKKILGSRVLSIYLLSIIIGSMLFGLGLDYLFGTLEIDPKALIHMHEDAGLITLASSVLLWGSVLYLLLRPYAIKALDSMAK